MEYLGLLVTALYLFINAMYAQQAEADSPLVIKEPGSFAIGGTVPTDKYGHLFHVPTVMFFII